ncbi:MAG: tetraacyldisaccharide 4'-kinase [Alphaproteobacteria bacterium]|nr:tetraacyldisaccharide 4'-kinase [Alphaproteobacteria bacterium]MDA8009150.1 tetraacyldisaccharide 4'-kinase [Alphaproteobacteria bacterium]
MRTPAFWNGGRSHPLAVALAPLSVAWGAGAELRRRAEQRAATIAGCPVICVGNVVAGGGGKTPLVLWLLKTLRERGADVHGLARGVGGSVRNFERVGEGGVAPQVARHGDEACMIAAVAPTWVGQQRGQAVRAAAETGAAGVISDDGMQSPTFGKDFVITAFNAGCKCGNGRLVPAGPLREPLAAGLARADAVFITHDSEPAAEAAEFLGDFSRPVFHGRLVSENGAEFHGRRLVAFCGIARPRRFFHSLRGAGAELVHTRAFGDHHRYGARDLRDLKALADSAGAALVTTEKDAARLPGDFAEVARARLQPERAAELLALIESVLKKDAG